jgi:hypothetical protein
MKLNKLLVPAVATAVLGGVLVAPGAVFAAPTNHHFIGFAGGSAVKALGSTVESDLTSQAAVDTVETGVSNSNTAATAVVNGVLTASAVTTSVQTVAVPGGVQLISTSHTAGASLLNGAITVGAVDTVNTTTVMDDANRTITNTTHTTFVDLRIAGAQIPVNIPQNFNVTIPGVASVYLNEGYVFQGPPGSGAVFTIGSGLYVTLLKGYGASPAGTEVYLNPTYTAIATVLQQEGPLIGGLAFGTMIDGAVGDFVRVNSGPTAQQTQPFVGTNGLDQVNSTGYVNLGQAAQVGAVSSTANGVKSSAVTSYSRMTTNLAHVNLLNGAITADAITGQAYAGANTDGTTSTSTYESLVNLSIGGKPIPVNVAPNTVIKLGDIATIVIRKEAKSPFAAVVEALEVTINTATLGLPAGARIIVGYASAAVQTFQSTAG